MSAKRKALLLVGVVVAGMAYMVYRVATFSPWVVREVVDADQIVLNTDERLKLIGIQVPPMQVGGVGLEASKYVRGLATGRRLRVELTKKERRPSDNWYMGYAWAKDGDHEVFLNLELLKHGYARMVPNPWDRKYEKEFQAAQREAKAAKRGIWNGTYRWPGT